MKQLADNIPYTSTYKMFTKNAKLLKLTPLEYFNKLDLKSYDLSDTPETWDKSDWDAFHEMVQYDSECIFHKMNNL